MTQMLEYSSCGSLIASPLAILWHGMASQGKGACVDNSAFQWRRRSTKGQPTVLQARSTVLMVQLFGRKHRIHKKSGKPNENKKFMLPQISALELALRCLAGFEEGTQGAF